MNRIEAFQARVSEQGQSMFEYTADWIEWSARKNLGIADDVAEFAVAQLRLPIAAEGFGDYRRGLQESYTEFGEVLKRHGDDYVSRIRDVPADIRAIFEKKATTKKATAETHA